MIIALHLLSDYRMSKSDSCHVLLDYHTPATKATRPQRGHFSVPTPMEALLCHESVSNTICWTKLGIDASKRMTSVLG